MSTEEQNILIAEFMGYHYNGGPNEIWRKSESEMFREKDAKYHTSWDWLMPVVEKIESTSITIKHSLQWPTIEMVVGNSDRCTISSFHGMEFTVEGGENLIQCVYQAVVQFIQWYNENK